MQAFWTLRGLLFGDPGNSYACCACVFVSVAGLARAATNTCVPFLIESDTKMLICVDRSTSPATKTMLCLSEIAHQLCTQHGMTEMNLTDHGLVPTMDEDTL